MSLRGSMHLPGDLRDRALHALAGVLGFDFWALDEATKEDAARAIVEALGIRETVSGGLEDEAASEDYKELQGDLEKVEEKLANAEKTIVELREFKTDACALFGVQLRNEDLELDRPIGDLLDDLSDARQALESRAETAELEFREFFVNVCILFNVATTEPVGDGIEVDRLIDDVLYDLGIVRQGLGGMNHPPSEAAEVLAEALDERVRLIKALGLNPSATSEQVLKRVEDLAQFSDGVGEALQDLDLPQTANDVIARVDEHQDTDVIDVLTDALDEIVTLLGLDPRSTGTDVVQAVRNLVEKHETLLAAYKAKIEVQETLEMIPDSSPLRGVL